MKQILNCCALIVVCTVTGIAQSFGIGGKEYGLASSSVMWMQRGSALFLNPAELGRIHHDEFLLSTSRFRNLSAMTGTVSIPFIGSFSGGVSNQDSLSHYTLGFGRRLGRYHVIGTSVTIMTPIQDGFRYSFGSTLHFPSSEQNSGLHVGFSASNLPKETMLNGGIAWWAVHNWFRIQAAAQNRIHRAMVYGGEILVSNRIAFLIGSRAFKTVHGGMSYQTEAFTADLTAGPGGLSFSLNVILGETAQEKRSFAYEEGYDLFLEKRYAESLQKFSVALEYDEYDDDSYFMKEAARAAKDSIETTFILQAKAFEIAREYPAAIDAYLTVLRANPTNTNADALLANARREFHSYIGHLIFTGDSLKERKESAQARKNYELVLKYDPENDIASSRIDDLENLSKENVKGILTRAQSLLSKKQFDNAQKEYERVLNLEPKNSRAKAGLNAIKSKQKDEQFEEAKTALAEGRNLEALKMLIELSKQQTKYKDLNSYIDLAREQLLPIVERQFKNGLSYYAKEDYSKAIVIWDEALLINPRHTSILEYRKRAEEKMKALEQLK
ncbi:MAG: hypothetical protein HYV29_02705 [Ignavibacteriales bacterium]|nr:hypothetical protein [Ignavibacteriales bacterium]